VRPLGLGGSKRRALVVFALAAIVATVVTACGGSNKNSNSDENVAKSFALPGADLHNTRYVKAGINSGNVSKLHQAWAVPIKATGSFGTYATTPVVANGIAYTQDISSNVYAIDLKTGKVKWYKSYNSPSVGPNGVTFADGVVYGATNNSAFALQASTGEQLWIKKMTRNGNEGIDMAPGINDGTLYISTVPGNSKGFYKGNGQAILWAMNAKSGDVKWKWEEVPKNLWSDEHTDINSGGGQWDPPSFDDNGDVYVGVSNPAPFPGAKGLPFGASRPGPNLYTDSIVKLDHTNGKLIWHYQAIPHDIYDWDMENSPILTTGAGGKNIVIDGGKMGVVYAVDQDSGKLLWKRKVGKHNGHDDDNLKAMNGQLKLKYPYTVYPGVLGGVESQLASDGDTVYAAVNNLGATYTSDAGLKLGDFSKANGVLVAINQDNGQIRWQHQFDSSPYGAATVSNDVVFTTTFDGTVWALNSKTGDVLWSQKLPAGTNTPVSIAGDTLITAGSFPQGKGQKAEIVAYSLSAPATNTTTAGNTTSTSGSTTSASGKAIFSQNCATCHTLADANASGNVGPNLDQLKPSKAQVQQQVENGGGGMPAFHGRLSQQQIAAVASYVASVAGKGGSSGNGGQGGTP